MSLILSCIVLYCFYTLKPYKRIHLTSIFKYLGSISVVRVDWARIAARFEDRFYTKDVHGSRRPPNLYSLWNRLVDFLAADFQPRASFIAGLALGLRIG